MLGIKDSECLTIEEAVYQSPTLQDSDSENIVKDEPERM